MMIGPQDALGVLYSFILLICPPAHKDCTADPVGAIEMRQDGIGLTTCQQKIEIAANRVSGDFQGRVWLRCEKHEEPTA